MYDMERSERLNLRIKPVLMIRLETEAKKKKISVSQLVRQILVSHYDGSEMTTVRGGSSEPIEPVKVSDALS